MRWKEVSRLITNAMKDPDQRVKPDLTQVIEPEVAVKKVKPMVGTLGQVLVDKGKVIKQVPVKPYKQNEEQSESNKWSQIKTSKKTLNEEEYHKKIERKLNDLVIKIEKGELTLDDLSKADQNYIRNTIEGFKIQIVKSIDQYDELKYLSGEDALEFLQNQTQYKL